MTRSALPVGNDDPGRRMMEWVVKTADPKGGWTCRHPKDHPASSRTLDAGEASLAFAVHPREKCTSGIGTVVERGAESHLERELHRQGDRYDPGYRFHRPTHNYDDLLVGLDVPTALGTGNDKRLGFALELLEKKRRRDGRWNLDAVQPDPSREAAKSHAQHLEQRPTPLAFEIVGRPSRMITLRSLVVLSRAES